MLVLLCQAQYPIKGKIADKNTSQPLEGVTVVMNDASVSARTDAGGQFSITTTKNQPVRITISLMGYKQKVVDVPFPAPGYS